MLPAMERFRKYDYSLVFIPDLCPDVGSVRNYAWYQLSLRNCDAASNETITNVGYFPQVHHQKVKMAQKPSLII